MWLALLSLIFPFVREARIESARLAYQFFHDELDRVLDDIDDDDFFADDDYEFEWFVKDMERARKSFSIDPGDDPADILHRQQIGIAAVNRAVARAVENSGRRAMIYAVDHSTAEEEYEPKPGDRSPKVEYRDPRESSSDRELPDYLKDDSEPELEQASAGKKKSKKKKKSKQKRKAVKGWARVATGRETCAFCLVMISRGPVYTSSWTAGLELDDKEALEMLASGEDLDEYMNQWHEGCDCKVVPVFDYMDWPGRDESKRLYRLWRDKTKGYSGHDAMKAFRRAVDNGEIDPADYAAAA